MKGNQFDGFVRLRRPEILLTCDQIKSLCALMAGSVISLVMIGLLLAGAVITYVPVAHASAGQCRWESGPGSPTFPSCKLEDCIGNGGLAQCAEPIRSPPGPFTSAEAGGDGWMYFMCNEGFGGPPDTAAWCAAAGGSWNGSTCNGLGSTFPRGNPTISNSEGVATSTSFGFASIKNGSCATTLQSDSGWGATTIPGTCYSNAVSPSYRNGILVNDYRLLKYFAGATCNAQTPTVWVSRRRQLTCPMNSTMRNRPDGGLDCVIPAEACCQKGNPVSLITGAKWQKETDYDPGIIGGVALTRYYNSGSSFKMLGSADTALSNSDFWRHSYDRRLFPVTGNATLTGVAQRPDGTLLHFDGSGKEILNRDGGAAQLQTIAGGWKLTLGNSDVETYNSNAKLVSIKTRAGLLTSLTYDTSGRISTVRDDFGHQMGFAYNTDGNLATLTLPGGSTIQYGYDSAKRLITVTYPDTKVRT